VEHSQPQLPQGKCTPYLAIPFALNSLESRSEATCTRIQYSALFSSSRHKTSRRKHMVKVTSNTTLTIIFPLNVQGPLFLVMLTNPGLAHQDPLLQWLELEHMLNLDQNAVEGLSGHSSLGDGLLGEAEYQGLAGGQQQTAGHMPLPESMTGAFRFHPDPDPNSGDSQQTGPSMLVRGPSNSGSPLGSKAFPDHPYSPDVPHSEHYLGYWEHSHNSSFHSNNVLHYSAGSPAVPHSGFSQATVDPSLITCHLASCGSDLVTSRKLTQCIPFIII
jgi:hypothetical protein